MMNLYQCMHCIHAGEHKSCMSKGTMEGQCKASQIVEETTQILQMYSDHPSLMNHKGSHQWHLQSFLVIDVTWNY